MSKNKEKPDPKVFCPYCNQLALWCENKVVYGCNYGKSYMCYYCADCKAYVGCHLNTRQPLGTMANRETRQWRIATHSLLDPLWQSGQYERREVYKLLRARLGREVHVGESNIAQCKEIIGCLQGLIAQQINQKAA